MKRVLFACLACAVAGCVVQKPSTVNGTDAIVDVTWSVRDVAGVDTVCPDGITVAQVLAQPVDPTVGTPEGSPTSTLFDCDAKSGTVSLVPGTYLLSVRLESADSLTIYADSLVTPVLTLTIEDTTQSFDIYTDGGYLSLTWGLVNKLDQELDCETAEVSDIRVVLTPTTGSGSAVTTDAMNCVEATATTSVIPAGEYSLAINAEENGTIVGTFAVPTKTIMAPNEVAGLGTITIPLTTM